MSSVLGSGSKHAVRVVYLIQLLKYSLRLLKWISTYCFQVFFQQRIVVIRIPYFLRPFDFKSHYSRFFCDYSSIYSGQLRLRWYFCFWVLVLIDDVVAHSKELLIFIGHRDKDSGGADDFIEGNFLEVWRVRVSVKCHATCFDISHIELVNHLVVVGICG